MNDVIVDRLAEQVAELRNRVDQAESRIEEQEQSSIDELFLRMEKGWIGEGGETTPGPFEPVYTNGVLSGFENCIFCAERQFVNIGNQTITGVTENTNGYVVLTITHPNRANTQYSTGTVAVENTLPDNANSSVTKIPLYKITDGVIDIDLRAVPTGVLAR